MKDTQENFKRRRAEPFFYTRKLYNEKSILPN